MSISTIVLSGFSALAQEVHEITLAKKRVEVDELRYGIVDVVDGRKDTLSIGWVQAGLANRKRLATFSQPAHREIMQLLQQSGLIREAEPKVVLRIAYIAVSEQSRLMSENARAQVGLDLFLLDGDNAQFVGREYATVEDRGGDVTHMHAGNIARAIGQILTAFNEYDLLVNDDDDQSSSISDIATFEDSTLIASTAPIYTATKYPNGLYTSFNEFRENKPSIVDGYEVYGGNQIKVRWVDNSGRKRRVRERVYALAHNNNLYIFFDNNFYLIEKRNHGFYFLGPDVQDAGAAIAGGWLGGAVGAAFMGATTKSRVIYRIDLSNGSLRGVGVK